MRCQTLTSIVHLPFVGSLKIPVPNKKKGSNVASAEIIAGQKFLSQQAEGDTDEQYNPSEEIDTGVQNSNLLLTSDHEYTDHFKRPAWG
jgi:hypothetical protein